MLASWVERITVKGGRESHGGQEWVEACDDTAGVYRGK